jgi:hypothetical protein
MSGEDHLSERTLIVVALGWCLMPCALTDPRPAGCATHAVSTWVGWSCGAMSLEGCSGCLLWPRGCSWGTRNNALKLVARPPHPSVAPADA